MAKEETAAAEKEVVEDFAITDEKIKSFSKNIHSAKAKMEMPTGEHGQLWRQFEEEGGHKKALKLAHQIQNMESVQAQEFIRNLHRYLDVLGVYDQHDLFDATPVIGVPPKAQPAQAELEAVH